MPPPKAIPDRWIPYASCGKVIEGTRIICFKVPLSKAVQVRHRIKEIWDINTLLEKIPKLGAVIDLTNTDRYYDPRDLQAEGILHQKIFMPGRVIPPEDKVQQFMDTVDEFLGKDCDFLVGVHCTHGLNRTGYMVCRYMRDRLKIGAKIAIKRFQAARGYEIERANYIADLLGEPPVPPDTFESKSDRNNDVQSDKRSDGPSDRHQNRHSDKRNASHSNRRTGDSYKRTESHRDRRTDDTRYKFDKSDKKDDSESEWTYDYRYDY